MDKLSGIVEDRLSDDAQNESPIERGVRAKRDRYEVKKNPIKPIIDRIYYDTLLADPAINQLDRFTVKSIRQNQKEDAQLSIIRDFVDAVDVNEAVETLPAALRREVKEGKYVIEDKHDLLVFPDKLGRKRIVLPPEH